MRRLSAIMFTDMVGYSALTQENEALALELLEEHRKLLRPFFQKHDGREIETAGDSFFVEFNSAVEATSCAIEIQSALHERNKTEPKERHILLRIGLHIGDVVYTDNHVHGDGVNIAARMEPLALPGGICVSVDVARQIRNKVPYQVVKLGQEKLKNISIPMDIYCIALPWVSPGKAVKKEKTAEKKKLYIIAGLIVLLLTTGLLLYFTNKKQHTAGTAYSKSRLAVLPFVNISNNPADEFFADGMTEELISSLSKIRDLNVIARTSVMKYKTSDKDIAQIRKELMVGTILEGSVRRFENKARITVQLIDAASQEHIWSNDFDRELKDIIMIQNEIAQSVADELKIRLVASEKEQLKKSPTDNIEAFQEYLVGKHFLNKKTPESIQAAITHFEKSTAYDSSFALPYANVAYCYTLIGVAGYGGFPRAMAESKAKRAVMKALEIDPSLAEAHAALGYIKFRIDWDWENAEKEFKKAIELKPGYATAHEWYALFLAIHSRLDEALKEMQLAYTLDPLSLSVNNGVARIYHFRNENDKSLQQAGKTVMLDSNFAEAHFTAGMTYYKIKEYKKAETELVKAVNLSGRRPVMLASLATTYIKLGNMTEANKILAELEAPPFNNNKLYAVAIVKSGLGRIDEALDIFEKLANEKYGIMIYMKVDKIFFLEGDHPRFQQILRKIGLE